MIIFGVILFFCKKQDGQAVVPVIMAIDLLITGTCIRLPPLRLRRRSAPSRPNPKHSRVHGPYTPAPMPQPASRQCCPRAACGYADGKAAKQVLPAVARAATR